MRPVRQSIFPGDPSGRLGDCLRACVASLVSEILDDVPHFIEADDWFGGLQRWVESWSDGAYTAVCVAPSWPAIDNPPGDDIWPDAVIATGPSPRGIWHHCVLVDPWTGALVHDPHPSDAGLAGDPVDLIVLTGDVGLGMCGTEVPW